MKYRSAFIMPRTISKRSITVVILWLLGGAPIYAQSNYSATNFRNLQQGYQDISAAGNPIPMTNPESGVSAAPQEIGFTFQFNGTAFTQFMIHADGILKLGTTAPGAATDISVSPANSHANVFTSTSTTFQNIILPFFTNLVQGTSVPEFHVSTTGTAPNRVCTIQWKNLRDADNASGGTQHQFSNLEFQVKLYETSNDIELCYGVFTASASPVFGRNAAAGIKASSSSFLGLYRLNSVMPYQKAVVFNATSHARLASSYPFRRDRVPPAGFTHRFFGRLTNDICVSKIYYDSIVTAGQQAPGRVDALVTNEGATALSNITVTLTVSGVNTHTESLNIPSLAAGASTQVSFAAYAAPSTGTQILSVTGAVVGDERSANDLLSAEQIISRSHNQTRDFSTSSALGVGFNNVSGSHSAIKMYGSGTRKIRQLRIPFGSYRNLVTVKIYEDEGAGGSPSSTPLFTSTPFFTTSENIMLIPLGDGITVTDNYFIAVQQNTTVNMQWRIIPSPPIRLSRYYNSSNGINWAADASGPIWEFMAEAYEESIDPDIGIERLTSPVCAYESNADVKVALRNFSAASIDFALNPTTISGFVRAPDGTETPVSFLKNTGVLAPGAEEELTVLTGYNSARRGLHLFSIRTNLTNDAEKGNDSLRFFINNNIPVTANFTDSVCPLTSVTLTGPSYLSGLQWQRSDGTNGSTNPQTFSPLATTMVIFTGTDYRGCLLRDSVIVPVRSLGLPPKPQLLFGDTILSHRNAFRDTIRVRKLDGHTIQWLGGLGTVVADSALVLNQVFGLQQAKVAAAYRRTADGCANVSDTITYRYAPGVQLNNFDALTVCDTSFYDAGGATGLTGGSFFRTFTPASPGQKLKLTFYGIDLADFANLLVFDGPFVTSPRITAISSTSNGITTQEFISSNESGVLTIEFTSGSFTTQGWYAGLTCYIPEVYRTVADGNWTSASTWERRAPGGSFVPALRSPKKGDDTVFIRHNVILSVSTPMDQVIVDEGAVLNFENPNTGFISMPVYKSVVQPELLVRGTLNISPRVQLFGSRGELIVPGRLNNFGQIDLDSVVFNGTSPQMLGNFTGASGRMRRLHINNSAGLTMGSNQEVTGFRFVNGLIHTSSSNIITLRSEANEANAGHDASHVSGPLTVELESASGDRLFPIGREGRYRPVLLNNTSNASEGSDLFTAEVIPGPPPVRTLPPGLSHVSEIRYYRVTRNGNSGLDFTITLPYGDDDRVSDPAGLTIAKDDGAGAWVDLNGTASGPAPGTIESGVFNGFSDFVLANKTGGLNALPVTWRQFKVSAQQGNAALFWSTATESSCGRYEIERSRNGQSFEKVGTVSCANAASGQEYRFTDLLPGKGTFYYRLRQVDADGRGHFSPVRKLVINSLHSLVVYPNPASDRINLNHLPPEAQIRLFDAAGRLLIHRESRQLSEMLNTSRLASGLYELRIESEGQEIITRKIQIIR